jgi:hypothetical protein
MAIVMHEEWKDIDETYRVSNLGRVYNTRYERFLKPQVQSNGYLHVALGRKKPNLLVHRLVAEAFIPNPNNLPEVNHIDEVKLHCMALNLEWSDSQHNKEHSFAKTFKVIDPEGAVVEGRNVSKFAREHGLIPGNLSKVINGIRGSHRGWRKY